MAKKLGVYLCAGCGIGEALNLGELADCARRADRQSAADSNAGPVRTSQAFCLEDAALIREDIDREGLEGVVIAACSPRVNRDVFRFPGTFVERVNLREHVAWSHPPLEPETQSLARDYLEMGIARAERAEPPQPLAKPGERTVLVVGGGPAGISAACSAARSGYSVVLVESAEELGGYARRLYKQYASRPPFDSLVSPTIVAEIAALDALPNVTIHLRSKVVGISGQPGHFLARIASADGAESNLAVGAVAAPNGAKHKAARAIVAPDGTEREVAVGAIVLATGWQPLADDAYARYGLGILPDVVTSNRFEEMARSGAVVRPSDGKTAERVAILLCDAPGDDKHLPYGGTVASLVALKQALYVRQLNPKASVYLLYNNLHALGLHEYFYRKVQADPGVLFCQGKLVGVAHSGAEGTAATRSTNRGLTPASAAQGLIVTAEETTLGGAIELEADLVVLATAMTPRLGDDGGALNLEYLQGTGLPMTRFGFADSNFICFPYETQRTGIYTAGAVRKEMDVAAATLDGQAAALKAMQAIERSSAGEAVHPRSKDASFPEFFMQKCTSCGRCTQECPFGALELDERGHPILNANRCRRCGICMGACPVQIISFKDYSVDSLSAMIKAVDIPEDGEDKPRILVLACENDAYPALDMAGLKRLEWTAAVRVIPVRCLGSVNSILVTDAVSRGFDGVALLGCKPGEDYQCHFIRGSELLGTRMDNMRETLGRLMLEPERVNVIEVAISDSYKLPAMLEGFVDQVRALGPNPMKGF